MKQIITNNKIIDDVYYVEKVGDTTFQRIITAIYKGGKQVWELIIGYLSVYQNAEGWSQYKDVMEEMDVYDMPVPSQEFAILDIEVPEHWEIVD